MKPKKVNSENDTMKTYETGSSIAISQKKSETTNTAQSLKIEEKLEIITNHPDIILVTDTLFKWAVVYQESNPNTLVGEIFFRSSTFQILLSKLFESHFIQSIKY